MTPSFFSSARGNARAFRPLSYALLFLMMACGILSLGILLHQVAPSWQAGIIAGALLFLVIDRLYTYRQLKSLTPLSSEWAVMFGAQWLLIVVVIRLLLSYARGVDSFAADLGSFTRGDLAELFTLEFIITLLFALLLWYVLGQFLDLLDEIGLDPQLALEDEPPLIVQGDAVPAHQRLVNLVFSVGILLVVFTALSRINLRAIAANTLGLPDVEVSRFSGAEAGALFFFLFGLALLSLSRLMTLQTRWNRLRIPISSRDLTRRWGIYSLVFLFGLVLLVSLLPAGDTFGFFSVLGGLLRFLLGVLVFISQLIVSLLLLLFALPFMLFGQSPPILNSPPPPDLLPALPTPTALPPASSAVWAMIRSVLLWGALVVLLVFAARQFLRQHESILAALRRSRIVNWLVLAWQWLYKNAEQTGGALARVIAEGWQSLISRLEGTPLLPRPEFFRLRSLDPRRQVYFFYLAMVRRSAEQGVSRKPSQTPAEYAARLEQALPSAAEDVDALTEAFVEARYSRLDVDAERVSAVQAMWGRIRSALQSKAREEKASKRRSS